MSLESPDFAVLIQCCYIKKKEKSHGKSHRRLRVDVSQRTSIEQRWHPPKQDVQRYETVWHVWEKWQSNILETLRAEAESRVGALRLRKEGAG